MPRAHPGAPARVVLFGRPGCHLCDDAEVVVAQVCDEEGVAWEKRSILDDEATRAAYAELIPVITVDEKVVATWRVTADAVRDALRE